jgi:hypothetical protein
MMRKLLLAAPALLALTGAAQGEDYAKVGNWTVETEITYCSATGYYPASDQHLTFAIGANGKASIVITNPKWNIPEGEYAIRAAVDDKVPANFTAKAEKTTVLWDIALGENNIGILSRASVLHVYIGSTDHQYSLAGSAAMLGSLVRCAGELVAGDNPFGSPQAAPVSTPSNPFKRT